MEPILRPGGEADVGVLLALVEEYYAYDHLRFDAGVARRALERLLRDPSLGRVWLICDGEAAAGYIVLTLGYGLEYGGRDAFVDELFLREPYRGRGWGRRAVERAMEAARETGVRAVHLEVTRGNAAVQAFYRRFGFEDHDRYLMTKWLSGGPGGSGAGGA